VAVALAEVGVQVHVGSSECAAPVRVVTLPS
jgi:hypothetical protein